ncbi:MAG: DUF565 domain-containing protein [Cyanobacteriota bacterium]|jgi:hypothetical protein|nr:DUF565 domain-containing protein [Cyanobacteriota bacterium]
MQRTRLSLLFDDLGEQLQLWLINPWRRVSLLVIGLLGGYFFGVSIAAVSGQAAGQDNLVALFLVILAEAVSWLVYSRRWRDPELVRRIPKPLWLDCLNGVKLGAVYALAVEAFKLGS